MTAVEQPIRLPTAKVLNPVDVELAIQECRERIHNSVDVVTDAERRYLEAKRVYDRAYAHAYLRTVGPAHEKKYAAELRTKQERDELDVAYLAYKHAERTAKALVEELRALQSLGASVRAMFGSENGVGR